MSPSQQTRVDAAPSSSPLLKTTMSLVLLQLVSRLFSFSLNQLLLRSTTVEAFGVATIGFEVLRDTSLFLLREGLRGAVVVSQRSRSSESHFETKTRKRTLLLPLLFTPLLVGLFFLYHLCVTPTAPPPHYNSTLLLYGISALAELASEPFYLATLANWETLTSARVRVEGMAVAAKSISTLVTVWYGGGKLALLSFGVGQATYGLTLLGGLALILKPDQSPFQVARTAAKTDQDSTTFDPQLLRTSWSLTKQSFVKQLLTEGDKIAVGRLSKLEAQGGYAIALNYGSLVARIIFQPLEESSRLFFSRHLVEPDQAALVSSANLLSTFLLLYSHLTLILTLLAPSYTTPLLYHLLGPRWSLPPSSAPLLLRTYCSTYLPFLAFNGLTEAVFQSAADPLWIRRGSLWMVVCSVAFVAAVFASVRAGLGERGLILSNCVNMAMRIAFSTAFIRWFYEKHEAPQQVWTVLGPRRWVPKVQTFGAFLAAGYVVRWSEAHHAWATLKGMAMHVAVGASCGLLCLAIIFVSEKDTLKSLSASVRRKTE